MMRHFDDVALLLEPIVHFTLVVDLAVISANLEPVFQLP